MKNGPVMAGLLLIAGSLALAYSLLAPVKKNAPVSEKPAMAVSEAAVVEAAIKAEAPAVETVIRQEIVTQGVPIVLPVPDEIDFCGERVPLDRPDIKERLERELYIMAHRYHHMVFYIKKGHRVLDIIDKEIARKNLPVDLRYIAVAESDLNPSIRSSAGAKGVWQFMEGTAKRYKLRVDKWVDERMHVAKSTRSALSYLADNKNDLGSWTMAAAAYNMGENRAKRTQKDQRTADFYRLHMNEETSRYIFRILAAKILLSNPEKYGYKIPENEIYASELTKTIRINKAIPDLLAWSHRNNIAYYDLKRLNPWIISDRLPKGAFELILPSGRPETLAFSEN